MEDVSQGFKTDKVRLLRPPEAAKTLSISERKLWDLTQQHKIRCVRIGRSVRYSICDLEAFIESQSMGGDQ